MRVGISAVIPNEHDSKAQETMTQGGDRMKEHDESRRAFLIGAAMGASAMLPLGLAASGWSFSRRHADARFQRRGA